MANVEDQSKVTQEEKVADSTTKSKDGKDCHFWSG